MIQTFNNITILSTSGKKNVINIDIKWPLSLLYKSGPRNFVWKSTKTVFLKSTMFVVKYLVEIMCTMMKMYGCYHSDEKIMYLMTKY